MTDTQRRKVRWLWALLVLTSSIAFVAIGRYFGLPAWAGIVMSGVFGAICGGFLVGDLEIL